MENNKAEFNELTMTMDKYNVRLKDIFSEIERLREQAQNEARVTIESARKKAEDILSGSQREAQQVRESATQLSRSEAERLITEAKSRAKQLVSEAEDRARKDAREKTKSDVERILAKAIQESNEVVAQAKKAAERDASDIRDKASREVEVIRADMAAKLQGEAEAKSAEIVAQAITRAKKIIDGSVQSAADINQLFLDILKRTEATVEQFQTKMRAQTQELSDLILEGRNKLGVVATEDLILSTDHAGAGNGNAARDNGLDRSLAHARIELQADGVKHEVREGFLYKGELMLRPVAPCDASSFKRFMKFLVQIPDVRLVGEYGSEEEGTNVLIDISSPLPLLNILGQSPLVENVLSNGNSIELTLKPMLGSIKSAN